MARPMIRATLALLVTVVYIQTLKCGVQAEQIVESETKSEQSLPEKIELPQWRIAREARREYTNDRQNKKPSNKKMKRNTKRTKTKRRQGIKKTRQKKIKSRKIKNKRTLRYKTRGKCTLNQCRKDVRILRKCRIENNRLQMRGITTSSSEKLWRNDGRCGISYPLPSGKPGQCHPTGCCSPHGWCGLSDKHCNCPSCVRFSGEIAEDEDEKAYEDFQNKGAVHFDESIANLTVSRSRDTNTSACGTSNLIQYQSNHVKCGISQFFKCAKALFKAIVTCLKAEGIGGVYLCVKEIIRAIVGCVPCICKGIFIHISAIPPGCKACDGSPSICSNSWLVPIGGVDNDKLLVSTEIITSTGVCTATQPKTIPTLPIGTTAGKSAWISDENELIFCGGSTTFTDISTVSQWGGTDQCYSIKPEPGNTQWDIINPMNEKRSFYSLTILESGDVVAAGGIDENRAPLRSKEVYSGATKTWTTVGTIGANPRYGHCAVNYLYDGVSYLIIIGGSTENPANSHAGTLVPVKDVTKISIRGNEASTMANLPEALWSPACTMEAGHIFLSGGSKGNLLEAAETQVYRYDGQYDGQGTWTSLSNLNKPRYGHVMGTIGTQLVVAGGFNGPDEFYNSIENSKDEGSVGAYWEERITNLQEAREFAALAEVEYGTFSVNC